MRLPPFVITATEQLLRELLLFAAPADNVLSRFFRENPRLGGRDRGAIAEACYAILRNRMVFAHLAESGTGSPIRRLTLLGFATVSGLEAMPGLSDVETEWVERVLNVDVAHLSPELSSNLPAWLYQLLADQYGPELLPAVTAALNQSAPLDLRVNVLKSSVDAVQAELAQAPIESSKTPYSPDCLRIDRKPALQNLPLFKSGAIEVQDEGSQLLALLVGARRGEMVVDFCAGAGGKTLALGAAMRNSGRLYAFDVSEKRLANLKPRLARSGLSNVHPVAIEHERDTRIKRLSGKVDRVLVDAPCTGLGTLRRNPDVKWRLKLEDVAEMQDLQKRILASAAKMVKPGGRVVYGTCSLLQQENEDVANNFLSTHPDFELVPVNQLLAAQKIELDTGDFLKLRPDLHHTDGFFAAVFVRKASAVIPSAEEIPAEEV